MLLTLILFIAINIVLAWIDSKKIAKGKRILHGVNGLIYLVLVGVAGSLTTWKIIPALLFTRLIVFNIALSVFRFGWRNWAYITSAPKAITDKLAKVIFGSNGVLMYLVYAALFTVSLFL